MLKAYGVQELADYLGVSLLRAGSEQLKGVASLSQATEGMVAFYMSAKHKADAIRTRASAVITTQELSTCIPDTVAVLLSEAPQFTFAKCAALFKTPS